MAASVMAFPLIPYPTHYAALLLLFPLVVAADPLLLACGAPAPIVLPDGRVFLPDTNHSISPAHTSRTHTTTAPSSPLYSAARLFSADATYSLPVPRSRSRSRPDHHHRLLLLRLHFFLPDPAGGALHPPAFAVTAGDLRLISNFANSKTPAWGRYHYHEYLLPLLEPSLLHLRFSPHPDSLAFLNAIELFPAPDGLLPPAPPNLSLPPGLRLAETLYRVNAGASASAAPASLNDSFWRLWEGDATFLLNAASAHPVSVDPASVRYAPGVPPYAAPRAVYARAQEMADAHVGNQRFNLSWAFPVDPGFHYSVRLHFCDIVGRNATDLVFSVYLNNDTVLSSFDLSGKIGLFNAYFADFIVVVPPGLETILLQVGPPLVSYSQPNAILNGIEIMKLGDKEGSLDAVRRVNALTAQPFFKGRKKVAVVAAAAAGGAMLIVCIVGMLLFFRRHCKEKHGSLSCLPSSIGLHTPSSIGLHTHTGVSASKVSARSWPSSGPSLRISKLMSFSEIRQATKNFDEGLIIGVGGFGKVYKGVLGNNMTVAVKRGNPWSQQGLVEFRTEIEMLSNLQHRHLVSLIGYCHEAHEMALVYEFMAGGSLRKHLYGSELPPLSWKQRLEICIGAAKGLHYLHTGASETIIHRDVKTTNILLDDNLTAKVADFGLSKSAPALDQTHVSTAVKGSFGYLDPEYFRRQQLTDKSDVYSFGVVLLEVICARPAINPALPREQVNIVEWALKWQKLGQLERVIDTHLAGYICIDSLRKFGETAEKCLAEHGVERPTMGNVLWNLEYALELQESFPCSGGEGSSSRNGVQELPDLIPHVGNAENDSCSIVSDVTDTAATRVFSQILDPRGR